MHEEPMYEKWTRFVSEALSCLNRDLQWNTLPCSGGYYDQDEFFITIWEQVRYSYIDIKANDAEFNKED
jgi:hypothetical protein